MIDIKMEISGEDCVLEIKGHADYAEEGKDIVCAGVSAITGALQATLESMEDVGDLEQYSAFGTKGAARLRAVPGNIKAAQAVIIVFAMAANGYRQIIHKYPKHVRFVD
jgi:uncharacterized protein YsxB (DUF464 family)